MVSGENKVSNDCVVRVVSRVLGTKNWIIIDKDTEYEHTSGNLILDIT